MAELNSPPQRDGVVFDPQSEDIVEAFYGQQAKSYGYATEAAQAWNGSGTSAGLIGPTSSSRKVGWTIRDHSKRLVAQHAFHINPQAISRTHTSRSQLFATRGGFYVDTFGQGPTQIVIQQLVAGGQTAKGRYGDIEGTTARDDVIRFYKEIYQRVVSAAYTATPLIVRFHDNHLKRNWAERVYFPENSFAIERSVSNHNVWQLTITMVSLENQAAKTGADTGGSVNKRRYHVKSGDTLTRIAARLAGKGASHKRVQTVVQTIVKLNKGTKDDISKTRTAPIYNARGAQVGTKKAKRLHLYAGEIILIPTRV